MSKGIGFLSLLLAISTQAAVDDQIIAREAASAITLAGRIGEAAMYSVQADDDDDLEIFATASSNINSANDHWILLDWDTDNYQIIDTGNLQSSDNNYLSSYQVSHNELLLGQAEGQLTTITFTNNAEANVHDITESQTLLSSLTHEDIDGVNFDGDIQAIVNIEGADQNNYTVLCTEELIHILGEDELISTLQNGGYCQSGNIDYDEVIDNPGVYDQELVLASGLYYTFDGSDWLAKTNLSSDVFGDNFLIANIDDDDAEEILSQGDIEQLQSFSPAGSGSWVYISALQSANQSFNVMDMDDDGIMEVIFDYVNTSVDLEETRVNKAFWDTDMDSHITDYSVNSPYKSITKIKRLATTNINDTEADFFLFASNVETTAPNGKLLKRLSETDLSTDWSGIYSSHGRSFETLVKKTDGNTLASQKLVQIEQIDLGDDIYEYAYKFFSSIDFSFESLIEPDFTDNEIVAVNSLTAFDFDEDGVDELHAGGTATYDNNTGIVISSYLDGSDHYTLDTPTLATVSALYIGNVNLQSSNDIIAAGEDISDNGEGIGIHFYYDNNTDEAKWFAPGTGDTEFKTLIASNIKGDDKPEIMGLHSQLASYNPNAAPDESSFYNLSNLDLNNFTPITLENRDYQYALATDSAGMLYLIEPKDFDILATTFACSSELTAVYSVRIDNNTDVAFGVCKQTLMSWAVEYDEDIQDYGYSLYELASTDLGNADTSNSQLMSLVTDPDDADKVTIHLYALFANKFLRFELNTSIGEDNDGDSYVNYRDAFPEELSQWEDSDRDTLGDNQDGSDPDPSLNDIDNDGITDDNDPDNDPENDFNFDNDIDHGLPSFNDESLATANFESSGDLTLISVNAPQATDAYDEFTSNATPTITGSVRGEALTENDDGQYQVSLASGAHNITWQATDIEGNNSTLNQNAWVYPSIAFQNSTQQVGETQTAQIILTLSGTSPVYPVEVSIEIGGASDINNNDVTEDISQNLTLNFANAETEITLNLEFIDDTITEGSETLVLTILDTFNSAEGSESWTIDTDNNTHAISVADVNQPPEVNYSIEQDGSETQEPTIIAGTITLAALITDPNNDDTHNYNWDLSSLSKESESTRSVEIDAVSIIPGDYEVNFSVTDNGLPNLTTDTTFTLTIAYGDTDGDGVRDNIDVFPEDASETLDSDGDGVGNNADAFPEDDSETLDSDGDLVGNNTDVFPEDASESIDSDGDGVGDNSDAFPKNASETIDSDGDGVGNNSDVFPEDASETLDSDGDLVGNNSDAFPGDASEAVDSDEDGVGDNADAFPEDDSETIDSDGDGVGNNADAFDNDATETTDTDNDGVGDNADAYPRDATKASFEDDRDVEGTGTMYFYLLFIFPLLYRRKQK